MIVEPDGGAGRFAYPPDSPDTVGAIAGRFRTQVGCDLVAFERENGGSQVWSLNTPSGAMYWGYRLDLVDGTGGFDPVAGLMESLGRSQAASQAFLDPAKAPGRLDYLLTDQVWMTDLPAGELVPASYESPGYDRLGSVLAIAALDQPRSPRSRPHHDRDGVQSRF